LQGRVSDAEEGIDSIAWTPYGKVRKVEKADNSSVSFRYDASGNRIAKIVEGDTTLYVRDASGNVMGVYKNDTLVEQSIYGSSRLGLMTVSSKTGYRTLGGKKYELSNHLGNVLAVVSDNINLDQDSTWASVVNMTDYYPFGLAMDGRTMQDSSYRYGFNGKEADSNGEWGSKSHYDYGFRIYNPSIAKFLSVDPLARKFAYYTPYQFAGNRPIWAVDLDGREDEWYMKAWEKTKYGTGKMVTVASDVVEGTANSLVLVSTSVLMPIINQGYIISQEGIHEGVAFDVNNTVKWAVPYKVKDWSLVPQNHMMGGYLDYEDGKELIKSTVDAIVLPLPVKSPVIFTNKTVQKVADEAADLLVKDVIVPPAVDKTLDVLSGNQNTAGSVNSGDKVNQ